MQVEQLSSDTKLAYALKTDKNLRDDQELEKAFSSYVFHEIEKTVVGNVESDEDVFAKFALLWDDDYLYLLADVIDDTKTHIIGRSVWQNDSVEF